jgi:uncharacterized DUF497 family protein
MHLVDVIVPELIEFDWDEGNRLKNTIKHQVNCAEAEQIFVHEPLVIIPDAKHSGSERRYMAWGYTNIKRYLTVIYTVRNDKIRVISARDINKSERKIYDQNT